MLTLPRMARPLRIIFAGACYHVTARGNERRAIYADDPDREDFLESWGHGNDCYDTVDGGDAVTSREWARRPLYLFGFVSRFDIWRIGPRDPPDLQPAPVTRNGPPSFLR
jgi:hypothetical protein